LPGREYDAIRQRIVDAIGMVNDASPFPHAPEESDAVHDLCASHQVLARHGDIFDGLNYDADAGRNAATIGDALVVELIDRFPVFLQSKLGGELPERFLSGLRELGNVRPAALAAAWISNILETAVDSRLLREQIERLWDELVDEFLALAFLRKQDRFWNPFEAVDFLQDVLQLSKPFDFETISRFFMSFRKQLWRGRDSFVDHALKEDAFLRHHVKFVVYGHTHEHEIVPLDSTLVDGKVFEQIYVNTGTWNSYLFYRGDERSGRAMEAWSGMITLKP